MGSAKVVQASAGYEKSKNLEHLGCLITKIYVYKPVYSITICIKNELQPMAKRRNYNIILQEIFVESTKILDNVFLPHNDDGLCL